MLSVMEFSFSVDAMIRGYHVYRDIWDAAVGEELKCKREIGNQNDPYAVAVIRGANEITVGHLPR